MKKITLSVTMTLLSLCSMADNVSGFVVQKTDGSSEKIALSNLRSIKFADGNMIINGKDNSRITIAVDDISGMEFSDITDAITTIVGTENKMMTITDLNGRMVYKGESTSTGIPTSLHGVYIISVDGKSHKVVVK